MAKNTDEQVKTLTADLFWGEVELTNVDGQRRYTVELWSVQGDAAAGVGAVEEGRRQWRSSCRVSVERKEKEEAAAVGKVKTGAPCPYL